MTMEADCNPVTLGSPYIPVDSWVYPAVLRLYSLGYVDNVYLGMRPWTRASVSHMLEETGARIEDAEVQSLARTRRKDSTRRLHTSCATTLRAPARRTRAIVARRVGLHRGARHQRHTAARQLSSRLDDHQRLRPAL